MKEQSSDGDDDTGDFQVTARWIERSVARCFESRRSRIYFAIARGAADPPGAKMRDGQQQQRDPITPSGAIKSVPMIVEVFEAELRFVGINFRA